MKTSTENRLPLSSLKNIYSFCDEHSIDPREVVESIISEENDFEVDNFRFISSDDIDSIQMEELQNDNYLLGCFTDWFIADNTHIPLNVVKALQKAEAFEELGGMMQDSISDIQSEYSRLDGYGHHFAHYDGNEHEMFVSEEVPVFYVFRIN